MKGKNPVAAMKWIEVSIDSNIDITEVVSSILFEAGANGTQIQNPDEIKDLIDSAGAKELAEYEDFSEVLDKYKVIAYFDPEINLKNLKAALSSQVEDFNFLWREADDSEWKENWKKYYKPFNLTAGLKIIPTWEITEPIDINSIIMDPGMAFGTGTHESTSLCAGMIEKLVRKGDKVLDIGTGTGILSIVASKLGAEQILSIDIDPIAVKTANKNFEINNVLNSRAYLGELKDIKEMLIDKFFKATFDLSGDSIPQFDLIAANIISDVIIELSANIRKYLKKGGSLVCSGIISERENDVLEALGNVGFEDFKIERKNEWTAITAYA